MSRLAAGLLDGCLLGALLGAGLLLYGLGDFLLTGPPFRIPGLPQQGGIAGSSVAAVAYLGSGWALGGRTPGQHVAGLRVVAADGRALPVGRAALRAVLCVVFPVGLVWVLVSRRNASVQDLLVRTVVLYDWGRRGAGPTGPNRSDPYGS